MINIHIHYVIANFICIIIFALLHKNSKSILQAIGIAIIPFVSFILVYKISLPYFSLIIQCYVTTAIVLCTELFLFTIKFKGQQISKKRTPPPVTLYVIQFAVLLLINLLLWLIDTFPLDNASAVLFTIMQNNRGAENFILDMLKKDVFCPTIQAFIFTSALQFLLAFLLFKFSKSIEFSIYVCKVHIYAYTKIIPTLKQFLNLTLIAFCVFFALNIKSLIEPTINIYKTYTQESLRQNSELYLKHYVFADSTKINFPKNKKNLIFIMMESMETNFKNFTPELNELAKNNLEFVPGGKSIALTDWTIASQVAKFCGLPLFLPSSMRNSTDINKFFPYAKCLSDIFYENGYEQIFMQGSGGKFASTKNLLTQHSVQKFLDNDYYKKIKKIPERDENPWGFSDYTLYSLAKEELDTIKSPFVVYLVTIDTHCPKGQRSKYCEPFIDNKNQFQGILKCASNQVYNFIEWAKTKDWYYNTVFAIMGDHIWPTLSEQANVNKNDTLYFINFFINAENFAPIKFRNYSSLDMFPTVLESMGVNIKGHRLGLGTSLFSTEKTLLEIYGEQKLDSMLKIKSYQYDFFMDGKQFYR